MRSPGGKREEGRAQREERRRKNAERREKREEIPKEAARDPQMRSQKASKEIPRGLWASWRPDSVRGRDVEERVRSPQKHPRASESLFPNNSEKQRVLRRWSPARIPAFLQGPVTTSIEGKTRSTNLLTSNAFLKHVLKRRCRPRALRRWTPARMTATYRAPCGGQIDCIFTAWEGTVRHNPL